MKGISAQETGSGGTDPHYGKVCPPGSGVNPRDQQYASYHEPQRIKTKMCLNYVQNGHCVYNTSCHFAHGKHELVKKLDSLCYLGERCRTQDCPYAHPRRDEVFSYTSAIFDEYKRACTRAYVSNQGLTNGKLGWENHPPSSILPGEPGYGILGDLGMFNHGVTRSYSGSTASDLGTVPELCDSFLSRVFDPVQIMSLEVANAT